MNKIEEALWQDYSNVSSRIESMEVDSNEYKEAVQERDNLRNELIKLEQIKKETNVKVSQIQSENKKEKIRNGIAIATFVVSTVVSVCTINKTFKFDQSGTVTSTLGRSILNGVVPKLFSNKR